MNTLLHAVLHKLHWLPIRPRVAFKILILVFKCLHGLSPAYLSDFIMTQPFVFNSRSSYTNLYVPFTRLSFIHDSAFNVYAPRLWNYLPAHIRECDSLVSFNLKNSSRHTFLFCTTSDFIQSLILCRF